MTGKTWIQVQKSDVIMQVWRWRCLRKGVKWTVPQSEVSWGISMSLRWRDVEKVVIKWVLECMIKWVECMTAQQRQDVKSELKNWIFLSSSAFNPTRCRKNMFQMHCKFTNTATSVLNNNIRKNIYYRSRPLAIQFLRYVWGHEFVSYRSGKNWLAVLCLVPPRRV